MNKNKILDGFYPRIPKEESLNMTKLVKKEKPIVFTHEEYNKHIEVFIKNILNIAAKEAQMTGIAYGNDKSVTDYEVDRESIINLFEEIYNKLKQ